MKKFIKYTLIVLCVLFVILLLAPLLFKKQLVTQIKKEANQQLNATLNFDNDLSLSFIRNFPNASLGVKDLSIVGKGEYQGDTLAHIKEIHLVIDLSSLFGGKTYQIRNVALQEPYIQLLVDSAGKANWDITLPDTTQGVESPSSFKAALQKYSISDGRLIFSDTSANFYLEAKGLDHSGNGDFTSEVFDLGTRSDIKALTIAYGGIPYLADIATHIVAGIHIDLPNSKYTFKDNSIQLNGLTFGVNGFVAMPDSNDIQMDLSFKSSQSQFKHFLSLIPAIYQKDFDKIKASGTMSFNGTMKGVYSDTRIPAFDIQLLVQNGMFQYPDLPQPVSDVNLNVTARNSDGNTDHTLIDVKQLHFKMGSNPFDAHLTIQNPTSDPAIDGAVKGTLNLSDVSKIYPLEKGTTLGGILSLDISASGRLSAIEHKQYEAFKASGQAVASNIAYQSASFSQGIKIPQGTLSFSPKKVTASNIGVQWGKSDVTANGELNNLFSYLFGKAALQGNLSIRSHLLNLNELMGTGSATTTDTTSQVEAVQIPKNIDFALMAQIDRFIYDSYDLKNVHGKMAIKNGILSIDGISADMLGGNALISGTYDTRDPETPKTQLSLKVNQISIPQAFKTFNTVQALAPIAEFAEGNLSGQINLSTLLNKHLYPLLSSLNSIGNISVPNLNIKGFKPLQQVASTVGVSQLKNLNLDKLLLSYTVDSGFLKVKPFDFTVAGIKVNAFGKNGLNKAIDYNLRMKIPRSMLGDANKAISSLADQAGKLSGTDVKIDSMVNVGVLLGGTITQPTVKLDLSEEKAQLQKSLTSTVAQKLNQEKTNVINKLLKTDSGTHKTDTSATKPAEALKKTLQKGLKGLFDKKKNGGN